MAWTPVIPLPPGLKRETEIDVAGALLGQPPPAPASAAPDQTAASGDCLGKVMPPRRALPMAEAGRWDGQLCSLDERLAQGCFVVGGTFAVKFYDFETPARGRPPRLVWRVPVRVPLERFRLSKSQRRLLRANARLRVTIQPAEGFEFPPELEPVWERHKARLGAAMPFEETGGHFLGEPGSLFRKACVCLLVYEGPRPVAFSSLAIGAESAYSLHCFYEPEPRRRSLGRYTLLAELAYASLNNLKWLYLATCESTCPPAHYKLSCIGTEAFDHEHQCWRPLPNRSLGDVYDFPADPLDWIELPEPVMEIVKFRLDLIFQAHVQALERRRADWS